MLRQLLNLSESQFPSALLNIEGHDEVTVVSFKQHYVHIQSVLELFPLCIVLLDIN